MTRPLLSLALLFLLMPALPVTAQSPPARAARNAAPQAAVIAFADLCIMAPGPEAEDAAVRKRGGTPIKDTPPPGSAPGRHFDLQVDDVRARVGFGEWVCMLEIGAADANATASVFDDFVAEVFSAWRATPAQSDPPPPGGRILREGSHRRRSGTAHHGQNGQRSPHFLFRLEHHNEFRLLISAEGDACRLTHRVVRHSTS